MQVMQLLMKPWISSVRERNIGDLKSPNYHRSEEMNLYQKRVGFWNNWKLSRSFWTGVRVLISWNISRSFIRFSKMMELFKILLLSLEQNRLGDHLLIQPSFEDLCIVMNLRIFQRMGHIKNRNHSGCMSQCY